jgi:hypothetical protein
MTMDMTRTASEVILAGMGDTPEAAAYGHELARNAGFIAYCRSLNLITASEVNARFPEGVPRSWPGMPE